MNWSMMPMDGSMNWSMMTMDGCVSWSMSHRVARSSTVLDISNIATVFISNIVVDCLDSAIRKSNRVRSMSCIPITAFTSIEMGSRVVISNGIFIGIHSRTIILRLVVGGRGMMNRRMVNWSMVNRDMMRAKVMATQMICITSS